MNDTLATPPEQFSDKIAAEFEALFGSMDMAWPEPGGGPQLKRMGELDSDSSREGLEQAALKVM